MSLSRVANSLKSIRRAFLFLSTKKTSLFTVLVRFLHLTKRITASLSRLVNKRECIEQIPTTRIFVEKFQLQELLQTLKASSASAVN
jgi:hypothetical protein